MVGVRSPDLNRSVSTLTCSAVGFQRPPPHFPPTPFTPTPGISSSISDPIGSDPSLRPLPPPFFFFSSLVLFFVFSLCGSQTQIQTLLSEGSQTVEDPPSVYTSNTFTISYINYEGGYFGIRENEERCPLLPCGFFMLIVFCLLLLLITNTTESLSLFISQCLL